MYVLDTNICIALIRQKSPHLLRRITSQAVTDMALSALTVAELEYGVERSQQPERNRRALAQFLLPFTVLEFDAENAVAYGRVRTQLESTDTPIGALDTLIAAQSLRRGDVGRARRGRRQVGRGLET